MEKIIPKIEGTSKSTLSGLTMTFKSSNQNDYPIVYSEDVWDVADEDTELSDFMGGTGLFSLELINESMAEKLNTLSSYYTKEEIDSDYLTIAASITDFNNRLDNIDSLLDQILG